ncbi:endonuclease 8-like 3 [Penaeus japonicus]|uniref:endonuclease 8-like 3 n=1 Tax=Penaeus japonicus TaxID=27405 RepID=UPI001C70E98A|nr:endonuclease 8-like 3 [Penaeus japonicus]
MVEGPGCKLKGEKLKKRVKGQIVKNISGNAIEKRSKAAREAGSPFDVLIGMKLTDVKTLGKELFAIFENDACLRVHFLMAGSTRYNNEPREFGDGKSETPRLKLSMTRDEVGFYDSAVEMRSAAECLAKYDELIDLDICSPTFNAKRATDTILEHQDRLICDVILDQLILPGVGNIIKNEALFNAGINPNSKVKELSRELVAFLVKMNRDFTNIFYKCRKEGKDLRKHMNIYGKGKCPECGGKVTKCKPGEYERATFFCAPCQTNTLRSEKKLPTKNSLLGWVTANKDMIQWNCRVCTLENKPASNRCSACLTSRFPESPGKSQTLLPSEVSLQLQDSPERSQLNCPSPHTPLSSPVPQCALSPTTGSPETRVPGQKHPLEGGESTSSGLQRKYKFRRLSNSPASLPSTPPPVSMGNASHVNTPLTNQTRSQGILISPKPTTRDEVKVENEEPPMLCSGHKLPARKLRAEKSAENRGRIFYVCDLPKKNQCKFFKWGDTHHPLCGHGKISIIRAVLKQNANNGREFFCCPFPKSKQCDFFQWVEDVKTK